MKAMLATAPGGTDVLQPCDIPMPELPSPHHIRVRLAAADMQLARLRNLTLGFELMLTPQAMALHDERVRQRKILEEGAKLVEAGGMIGKIVLTIGE